VLSLAALECGVDCVLAAEPLGGLAALRAKSLALSGLFMAQAEDKLARHGLMSVTPTEPAERGSQVSLACAEGGYALMQALIARGVIGDFRAGDGTADNPDLLRFGFTPLYTRHVDVVDAVDALAEVLDSGEWRQARFHRVSAVT